MLVCFFHIDSLWNAFALFISKDGSKRMQNILLFNVAREIVKMVLIFDVNKLMQQLLRACAAESFWYALISDAKCLLS